MSQYWSAVVHGLTPYVPGEQPKMSKLVKLNTNECPYGPSEKVLAAIAGQNSEALRLYPDPQASALKAAIARRHGLAAALGLAWLLGAAIAVADGLVWAELGATFPRAGGSYAFTASNTVPSTQAGQGTGTVSGYTVSSVAYSLNASTPSNIDAVTFSISPSSATTNAKNKVPCNTNAVPKTKKAAVLWGTCGAMNCGTKAKKNKATLGFNTLVSSPRRNSAAVVLRPSVSEASCASMVGSGLAVNATRHRPQAVHRR